MITDSDNYQINLKKRKRYFELAHFKYQWRSYQKRILDDLDYHMNDNALHIVAPPGSGKTILGLEVAVRLNKPTLILAPTLAIRDQWTQWNGSPQIYIIQNTSQLSPTKRYTQLLPIQR